MAGDRGTKDTGDERGGGLSRDIGAGLLLLFVVGNLLGAGIYAIVGEVAREAGGLVWISFGLAAVLAALTAGSYLELATRYPRAGGAGLYVSQAFGRPLLTVFVTVGITASAVTSAAVSARAFAGDYLPAFVEPPVVLVVVVFLAALTLLNLAGASESLKVNVVLTLIILAGLAIVVVEGVATLASGDAELGAALEVPEGEALPLALVGGAALSFFAFVGFEDSVQLAEETKNPAKTFPKALFGGLAVATVVYLLVAVASVVVVPPDELADADGPLLAVVREGSLGVPPEVLAAVALVALTNTALLNLVAAARLLYGMSNRGVLPRALGTVWEKTSSPAVAVAVVALLAIALAVTGDLAELADTTVLLLLVVFTLVNASLLKVRGEESERDHVSVPLVVPLAGAVVSGALAVFQAVDGGVGVLVRFGALMGLGLLVYGIQRAVASRTDQVDLPG